MNDGEDSFKACNFVRNVYDNFAPQHLRRVQEAVSSMPGTGLRTWLSFAASDITLDEDDPQ
ncbi:hypothetical protein B0A48_18899, partial [Cryoendolithus antarcticus]